ncbi:DUF4389 domain-containing protein [Nocardia uniformis]|uniref:DUF4389 domain-containing protein n=1 Tax=Nocardia uniformis TaxID=53432 RepID=A0A849C6D7_9NOCA|nr:DUF4389 domain-containing protein [Nocardia uniformis]NNH71397.1 DUF4389 domain-containing protein [Nocardia uniformis]
MTGPESYPASGSEVVAQEPSVELDVFPPQQHSRWTVLLRLILIIPQAIVIWALGIAAVVVVICGWFGALFLGRLPDWCSDFLRGYTAYSTRVYAYGMLLVDTYPPFAWNPQDYPVRVLFHPPTPLNRVAVFFRLILAFPILVLASFFTSGWTVIAIIVWLIVLISGRMPQPVFEATAAVLRIQLRTSAYTYLITPTYLKGIFGDRTPVVQPGFTPAQPAQSPTRPLWVSSGGRTLLIVILVLGILASIGQSAVSTTSYDDTDTVSVSYIAD